MASPRIEAARKGERKYTGKPCKVCGNTERYVINAGCVECTKKSKTQSQSKIKELLSEAEGGR